MLPKGYDPASYGGKIWWNENNPKMRAIWGTQADYDKHIAQGGTWLEYAAIAKLRTKQIRETEKSFTPMDEGVVSEVDERISEFGGRAR